MLRDEKILNISNTDAGHRVDVNPPEGSDGCVILIEKRSRSPSP